MGCGPSGQGSVGRADCLALNGEKKKEKTNAISNNWERLKVAALLVKSDSPQVGNVTTAKRNSSTDELNQVPDAVLGEEELFELPTEESVHGKLGLTIQDDEMRHNLDEIEEGNLFVDLEFPTQTAMYYSDQSQDDIVWVRPKDLVARPVLFLDGVSRNDIVQGKLGDCWLMSACAAVAAQSDLIQRVIPPDQPLFGDDYKGIVELSFWRFGSWVKVHIDDQLPTKDGQLIYARCTDPSEFWVSLLEKAYAKLHTSYEAIESGRGKDAMVDLTGGLADISLLDSTNSALFEYLQYFWANVAFVTCARTNNCEKAEEKADGVDNKGLVTGHCYTLTDLKQITTDSSDSINLVRIRNPWGDETEWNGQWSDKSDNWSEVNDEVKELLEFKKQSDGEFWMSYSDFCAEFEDISVCTLVPDFDNDGTVDTPGQLVAIKGEWEMNKSAGGSSDDFFKFATNPQYLLTIVTGDSDKKQIVMICLMQEHRNLDMNNRFYAIAFYLYKCPDENCQRLPAEYFTDNEPEETTCPFIDRREVSGYFELDSGNHIIVPATFDPDSPSRFMIRVFSLEAFDLREVID